MDRIDELERRLDRMETRQGALEKSREMMDTLLPAETRGHLRAAGRENLLALRSLLDHWIEHLREDKKDSAGADNGREKIPID